MLLSSVPRSLRPQAAWDAGHRENQDGLITAGLKPRPSKIIGEKSRLVLRAKKKPLILAPPFRGGTCRAKARRYSGAAVHVVCTKNLTTQNLQVCIKCWIPVSRARTFRPPYLLGGNMADATCDIGLIGLAVMGQNLVLNMNDHGYKVAVFN